MLRSRTIAITLPMLLVVAACAGDDDASPASTTSRDAAPTTSATAEVTAAPITTPVTTTPAAPDTAAPVTTAPVTTAPATTAPPAEEWAPIGPGPYEVGVSTVTIDADGERPLTVDVWFPLGDEIDSATLAPQRYTLLPTAYYESPDAFAADAGELATDGPFPLMVYSHGSGGLRYLHSSYTEALASHG